MVPNLIIVLLVYLVEDLIETDSTARNIQMQFFFLLYFITTSYMSVDYIPHLIMRTTVLWSTMMVIILGRN